ncbi:MAG: hypothetical protein E1N59_2535 [Puniceicoccaceae bacterium 5H]|nr:MAG: hypothetical protein E1N59_2535 [Puniceicoccaceae bacterium 5H]
MDALQISILAVVVSLFALWWENRRTRGMHEIDLLYQRAQEFEGPKMLKTRHKAVQFLQQHRELPVEDERWDDVSDVLDFLQGIATLAKAGHIRIGLLYNFFGYWYGGYWHFCSPYVHHVQQTSPLTYASAQWLYNRLRNYDRQKNQAAFCHLNAEQALAFLHFEVRATTARTRHQAP